MRMSVFASRKHDHGSLVDTDIETAATASRTARIVRHGGEYGIHGAEPGRIAHLLACIVSVPLLQGGQGPWVLCVRGVLRAVDARCIVQGGHGRVEEVFGAATGRGGRESGTRIVERVLEAQTLERRRRDALPQPLIDVVAGARNLLAGAQVLGMHRGGGNQCGAVDDGANGLVDIVNGGVVRIVVVFPLVKEALSDALSTELVDATLDGIELGIGALSQDGKVVQKGQLVVGEHHVVTSTKVVFLEEMTVLGFQRANALVHLFRLAADLEKVEHQRVLQIEAL